MRIEKQPSLPYKAIKGVYLKVGHVYIRAGDVDIKEPRMYLVCQSGISAPVLADLATGQNYHLNNSRDFIEVKSKVVWEHVL